MTNHPSGIMWGQPNEPIYFCANISYMRSKYGLMRKALRLYGINSNSAGRNGVRTMVRIRDNFTCQDCGSVRTLESVRKYNQNCLGLKGRIKMFDVHHVDGLCGKKSKGYDNLYSISGLITLCHKCHYNRPEHTNRKVH